MRRPLASITVLAVALAVPLGAGAADRSTLQPAPSSPPRPALEHVAPQIKVPGVPSVEQFGRPPQALRVSPRARLLVFAPHPDDETLGAGGLIQRVIETDGIVKVVFVTNGDGYRTGVIAQTNRPNVSRNDFLAYGEHRHREALQALSALASHRLSSAFLGFPDDGIDDLWSDNWSEARPYRSPFTDSDRPPYDGALQPSVEYAGVDLRREIRDLLQQFAPDWVVIPDPRDRHPDHCSTGGFVLDALRELREAQIAPFSRTEVLTYLVHYPEYPGNPMWLAQINHAGIGGSTAAQENLSRTTWFRLELTPNELAHKHTALSRYRSQMRVMDRFLALFIRSDEIFGHLSGDQISTIPRDYATRWRAHRQP
ncbi:MAG TPA: PIG-L family deacetylase [Candidatus Binatia bacterium]|nr:PIG-L family deacetylase [Candidatus Binatia bacterium]